MKKFIAALMFVTGLSLFSQLPTTVKADSYNPILSQNNNTYTARFVNQGKRNDAIFTYGPYYTKRSTKTRDLNGRNWEHRFIQVTGQATTKTGTYVHFKWYGKTYGWVNIKAIERFSVSQNAKALIKKYHYRGSALLVKNYFGNSTTASAGYAYYGKHVKNTGTTVFPTASLQKVITASIIVQLVNEHKLTQYTRLSHFFPNVSTSSDITIRELLDHNSGLVENNEEIDPGTYMSEAQAINWAIKNINGTGAGKHHYTNANFILLAGIIRKLTGQSYQENVQNRVINKLGLKHTYLFNTIPAGTNVAKSYKYANGKNYQFYQLTNSLLSTLVGAGNTYSTPSDYYKIQKAPRNNKILNKSDYYYLMNHYKYSYDGGMWHYKGSMKGASGSLRNTGYTTNIYMTEGNKSGVIFFANQKGSGASTKTITQKYLYNLVRYYM